MKSDTEITVPDIQQLSNGDAICAFFARLGYNTNVRITQSPGNLGITADGTLRPIKKIELLADHENLLQVYLFELSSVTVTHTRSLARHFRNRAGNYLLVLTNDYERLDFVLLEKCLPSASPSKKSITSPQVGIRPRALTIERKKPSRVHLRVLRRFPYTEDDPFAQYDKLLSAYAVYDWSEEYFNNRALFSDYYILERIREFPEWSEDPKPVFTELLRLYSGKPSTLRGKKEEILRKELLEPVFKILGFSFEIGKRAGSAEIDADYRLFDSTKGNNPLAFCLAYTWDRSLDGKDYQRDTETPEENPGAVVVTLLEKGETPWVIVTNGKLWRLYSRHAHSRATNYYEIDLEEALAHSIHLEGTPAESFRYFWLFFRSRAYTPSLAAMEGEQKEVSFLDRIFTESKDYAKELGERLKERIFEKIFPHLAQGFIAHLREKEGLQKDIPQEQLDKVFQGALTFLYRLLFVLYAEARDLLPVKETRGYFETSLKKLKGEVAEAAGTLTDEAERNLDKHYKKNETQLYGRLARLFQTIDRGDPSVNVPVYNGGLFLNEVHYEDNSPEAENARFLNSNIVPDLYLSKAINLLTRDLDPKRQDLVPIDFKSLGVRQLGSIYEGLLEFKLRIAPEKMAIVKGKKAEIIVPYFEALAQKLAIQTIGRGKNAKEKILAMGEVYLENDKHERKATGSYYTPDHIVEYIVENAVGPVLKEKFEDQMRPRLREAQQAYQAAQKRKTAFEQQGMNGDDPEKVAHTYRHVEEELFNIKVLDPAMGSGHFLVEAVDFITDKTIDFLNGFPWNPVFSHLEETRQTILKEMDEQGITIDPKRLTDVNLLKRHVLKRCVYGVDLNPMAVELAKVSLWLDCFTLGAPLSFLDHHIKCGNSLIGTNIDEVKNKVEEGQMLLFGSQFTGLMLATDLMRHVGELSDATSAQVRQSRSEFKKASDALSPFKRILDVYTSQWFSNIPKKVGTGKKKEIINEAINFLKSQESQEWIKAPGKTDSFSEYFKKASQNALSDAEEYKFFHWELEFPEVFYGPRPGTTQVIEKMENGGFDAVIGNPPYDVLSEKELACDISKELLFYESQAVYEPSIRGKKNLYKLFICKGISVLGRFGSFSLIVPMALLGDEQSSGVRNQLLTQMALHSIEAFPQKDDPKKRVFQEAKLSTTVFVARSQPKKDKLFQVCTHPGRFIDKSSSVLNLCSSEILNFDPQNFAIPSCTQRDWYIATKLFSLPDIKRMQDIAESFQGEINETNERKRGTLTDNSKFPMALHGANICLYAVRDASQGEDIFIDVEKFLSGKKENTKAFDNKYERIGFQRKSPQNNFRRIIAAPIKRESFCLESVTYIPQNSTKINLNLLLVFLNSKFIDWFFRLGSTNAQVNEYQYNNLPIPTITKDDGKLTWKPIFKAEKWEEIKCMLCAEVKHPGLLPNSVAEALTAMCQKLQEIESKRTLKNRSERSRLAPESQPIQDAIDKVLFHCYGLNYDEAKYIEKRLTEML